LNAVGYWYARDVEGFPTARSLVGNAYPPDLRDRICGYLQSGQVRVRYLGWSFCRFRCGAKGRELGDADLTDGEWVWPQGLPHYVRCHGIRLPPPFIESMRKAGWRVREDLVIPAPSFEWPPPAVPEVTFDYWIEWARQVRAAADSGSPGRATLSGRDQQLEQLAMIEGDLLRRLEDQLERATHATNPLFFVTREFNPNNLSDGLIPRASEELARLASEALVLRETLGERVEGSVGFVFRRALRRAANLDDPDRNAPSQRAEQLLVELGSLPRP
jgi:hypothetical protein